MRKYSLVGRRLTGVALTLAVLCGTAAAYAQARLTVGGPGAQSGVHPLRASFTPDPFEVAARAGGALHVNSMRLGAGCRGYTDAQPDVIIRFSGAADFLRFFARSDADVTLLISDPNGRFLCNDDVLPGRNTNPMVDLYQPRAGQYDVWLGTSEAGQSAPATLYVTALRAQRP